MITDTFFSLPEADGNYTTQKYRRQSRTQIYCSTTGGERIRQRRQCAEPTICAPTSADLRGISRRILYRLIEAGEIHFVETKQNEIYIFPSSKR